MLQVNLKYSIWWSPSTSVLLFLSLYLLTVAHASRTQLTQLPETSCVCPNEQLVFECTFVGSMIQFTVWRGSALDCTSVISLRHGMFFSSGYANESCNNGAIFARIVNITDNCYTSQLAINTSGMSLDGRSVQCAFDDGLTETLVNTRTIRITTAPFSSPNDVRLVDVQPGQMTFNWTSVDTECKSLAYKIISSNCGRCPATTHNTTVTCIDVVASGQVCTFIVQTEVCGNLTGNFSNAVSVTLKVPKVSDIRSIPHYNHVTQVLQSITSSFEALNPVIISDGFQNHVISYSISYSDSTTGNICSQVATIPASMCHNGVCKHVFEVATSFCHPSTNITITVLASTMLGPAETTNSIIIDSRNRFFNVDVRFEAKLTRVTCTLLNPMPTESKKSCRVSLGLDQENRCSNLSYTFSVENNAANVMHLSVDFPTEVLMTSVMCFVVTASDGKYTAETDVERMLTVNSGCNPNQLSDGTVLPDGALCGPPLFTVAIRNGVVCYTGTGISATAVHHCFDCGYDPAVSSSGHQVRTCQPDGTWNGTQHQCYCSKDMNINASTYIAISTGAMFLVVAIVFIIVIVILATSKMKIQKALSDIRARENMQIYEEIDLSHNVVSNIDPTKNVAYETCPPQQPSL